MLVAVDGPVDAADDPVFETPAEDESAVYNRADVQLLVSREAAAQRVLDDSWSDYLPSVTALFAPQLQAPAGLFANSWLVARVGALQRAGVRFGFSTGREG